MKNPIITVQEYYSNPKKYRGYVSWNRCIGGKEHKVEHTDFGGSTGSLVCLKCGFRRRYEVPLLRFSIC